MNEQPKLRKMLVTDAEQILMLNNSFKVSILSMLKDAKSSSEVAKDMDETPQKINYHMKKLESVNLIEMVGHRKIRNLVEVMYQAVAEEFVVPDDVRVQNEFVQRMKDQGSLNHLFQMSEKMKEDTVTLMGHVEDAQHIPSAMLDFAIRFENEQMRKSFVEDYVQLVSDLVKQYEGHGKEEQNDDLFQVLIALYPQVKKEGE
ncbi:DNA-binding transcriptional ArsR family regulator [Salirhabdus euzebyi]|uniref:DNA-binding transcriptional ArsR family regulator n=1 Tax=Salirhabdus euzebyi TaxID=394506 RepID=A0A841Q8V1_9BACI|nr:helix-turn-helix domain-containing protein [Salirhabdus euzebyi]MBB6454744.1 DNA-binding transcriptional ArsR family regulator [Salirhabdus euzebyi]